MNSFVFYKDTIINQEIAFVFDFSYTYINSFDELTADKASKKLLYIHEREDIQKAINFGLKHFENFLTFKDICDYLNRFNTPYEFEARGTNEYKDNLEDINKLNQRLLLLPEMLIKVLYSKPKDIDCKIIIEQATIDYYARLWPCCPTWTYKPFGNIFTDGRVDDIYHSFHAKILKLSCLNKTYCFCDLNMCKYDNKELNDFIPTFPKLNDIPRQLTIASDKTCNLRCNSCRACYYIPTEYEKQLSKAVTKELIESDWINKCYLVMAGDGEIFFSKEYEKILNSITKRNNINILSNGTLFTEEKWKLLENKFKEISVSISVDAATKETYSKLRHGNFDLLQKNLKMLANLRKEKKLLFYQLNFVVQRDNMHEMKDFVLLAKSLNVDNVYFTLINDWYIMPKEVFDAINPQIKDHLDYELYKILQDPIFKDSIVNIACFETLIENSKRYYSNM